MAYCMTYGTTTDSMIVICLVHTDGLEESEFAMAYEAWVKTDTQWCDRMQAEADMMEKRIYASEVMPDFPGYQIKARKCSLGMACNLAGFTCKWSYADMGYDPFKLTV